MQTSIDLDDPRLADATTKIYKRVGDAELAVHFFFPDGWQATDTRVAIVFFFGGGWVGGTPAQFAPQCRHYASKGLVAATAEYRVRDRHGSTPFQSVADGKSAVRYLRQNASDLGIDPDRVIASGGSAGGHVAACAGLVPAYDEPGEDHSISSRPDALILFNPATNTSERMWEGARVGRSISPVHHVRPGLPPTVLFHGIADTAIPIGSARVFAERMRAAGNRCELNEYPGEPHGFFNYSDGDRPVYHDCIEKADAFLRSLDLLVDA